MRENIFGSLAVISVVIGGYMFFSSLFKKQFRKGIKWALGGFISMFICVMLGFSGDTSKEESQKEAVKQEAVKEETEAKSKEEESKTKAEANAKKEADENAKKEQVKQAYLKEIKPEINTHTKVYDDNWNKYWQPTMDAVSKGSLDYYTAYKNMQAIKNNYENGRFLSVEPVKGMDNADKKLLKTYSEKMGDAFTFRSMAVDIAMKGFDTGNLQPSDVDKIVTYSQMADSSMVEAVAAITTIEVSLGITTQ